MSQFADWFAPSLLRTSLTLIVAALLVATCVKWLRLRSPAGEQWAWLLILVQGVMFASLTVPVPSEWLPQRQPPQPEQTAPVEAFDQSPLRTAPNAVPLKFEVPERLFDRTTKPVEARCQPSSNPETSKRLHVIGLESAATAESSAACTPLSTSSADVAVSFES